MKKILFFFFGLFLITLNAIAAERGRPTGDLPDFKTTSYRIPLEGPSRRIETAIDQATKKVPIEPVEKRALLTLLNLYRNEGVRTVALAVTLGFINGTAATYSLVVSDGANLGEAIPVGIVLGSFGIPLRIFSERYLNFINGGKSKLENALRFFGVEYAFITLAKLASTATGISTQGPVEALASIFLTSSLGTLNQGVYDLAIAENKNRALQRVDTEAARKSIRLRSALKSALISVASVMIGVASVNDVPYAQAALTGFTVTGIAHYLRTFFGRSRE